MDVVRRRRLALGRDAAACLAWDPVHDGFRPIPPHQPPHRLANQVAGRPLGARAQARSLLGRDATLVVGQFVVVEPDPEQARARARGPLGLMTGRGGGYAAHLRRMGFAEDEIAQLSDRLVDALVAWGDLDAVAARVAEHLRAGADQVALSVVSAGPPGALPVEQWRQLAKAVVS
jgi:probable F420-dependent oxidoreductase